MTSYFKNKISVFLILSTIVVSLFTVSILNQKSEETSKNNNVIPICEYSVQIKNNKIVLLENDKILKEYEINISLLPGEDLVLLSEGIKVNSIKEADKLAEDFDG